MLDKTSCGGKTALETLGDEGHHKQSGHPHSLSVAADYNIGNIPGHGQCCSIFLFEIEEHAN